MKIVSKNPLYQQRMTSHHVIIIVTIIFEQSWTVNSRWKWWRWCDFVYTRDRSLKSTGKISLVLSLNVSLRKEMSHKWLGCDDSSVNSSTFKNIETLKTLPIVSFNFSISTPSKNGVHVSRASLWSSISVLLSLSRLQSMKNRHS